MCDGQLIIYAAVALLAQVMGDELVAKTYSNLYADRLAILRAWQAQGSTFAMSTEADLGEDESFDASLLPNWDRRTTIRYGS